MTKHVLKRMIGVVLCLCLLLQLLPQAQNVLAASSKVETALDWAQKIADDNSHGYSQQHRNGPDYDCSSYVSTALVKAGLNDNGSLTTYTMKKYLCSKGFTWIPWSSIGGQSGLKRGDILLDEDTHTEFYIGNGKMIGAHRDYGYPATGDQTGKEISVQNFYNNQYGISWNGVLRYEETNPPTYSNFWVDHYLFDLSETVSFTAVASGADNYAIGIDKNGVGRVVTEGCGSTYTISADRLGAGEYSAYMTVANSAGYVDTYRVYFVVAEKCNFGDKFSARIKNIGTGCYITNKDSKIVGTTESGYNNQIWFFNKYSDGSYTIMSQLDGLMMDVSYIDDPPAGADVHAWESTGKWNQRFNIYYLDDAFYIRPANTKTLVVDMGAGEPYNVACYNLSRNAGQQKYRFDMVGMGDYIPYGLGDEFYAQLRCQGTNLYVTNQSGNVAGTAATADDSQIWKFMRQSNGAYVIQNTLDGSYIDVENSNDANKTNFLSYNEYTGNRNQQFYFYEMDNAF